MRLPVLLGIALLPLLPGCLSTRSARFPAAPSSQVAYPDGTMTLGFDTTDDGKADYREAYDPAGRLAALSFDDDGDGAVDLTVPWSTTDAADAPAAFHLVLILDSVPYDLVQQAWQQGRFRYFSHPAAVIAPFPVMTDLSMNEMFGTSPAVAVETEYFDGSRLRDGWAAYRQAGNSPWLENVDLYLPYAAHGSIYTWPYAGLDRELDAVVRGCATTSANGLIAYAVATSALGIRDGREGHAVGLVRLEQLCRRLMHTYRGRVALTVLSDHGHDLQACQRAPLRRALARMGYRVGERLAKPGDVVVPGFGLVTMAGMYTAVPDVLAIDAVTIPGVELAMYRADVDRVVVLGRSGRATVTRTGDQFTYAVEFGDPLALGPLLSDHPSTDGESWATTLADTEWWALTVDHVYPDAVRRVWRAFHGLTEHPPDVLVSLAPGWAWGSPFMHSQIEVRSGHGNLRRSGSVGVLMTTAGALPAALRMVDVRAALRRIGAWPVNAGVGPETGRR